MYLATASGPKVRQAMTDGLLGLINTPDSNYTNPPGVPWCADNACFSGRFDEDRWWAWLSRQDPTDCLFAVAPDVVGDAAATLDRSLPWLPRIRALGFRPAFVAQDGLENLDVPWDEFDCLFIGGTTAWKLSRHAHDLAREAKARGKWLHMGRVNSRRRWLIADYFGCDSVDGTYLAFGPDTNLPALLSWTGTLS